MRNVKFLLEKEFKQVFRNKAMLPIIFVMPIIQLLVLANAATFDIKNLKLYIVDKDMSSVSRQIINKFEASPYFVLEQVCLSEHDADAAIQASEADLYIEIPNNFEYDLVREKHAKTKVVTNAIDGTKAGLAMNYAMNILNDYNVEVAQEMALASNSLQPQDLKKINVEYSNWYNEDLKYDTFMVPGILVLLVTMIGTFLSSMNIVKEKEIGTIEQINVTPIKKHEFIIGKLLPFLVIALFELALGLVVSKLVYNIPILGSIGLIFLFATAYMIVFLGIGLFISTFTTTQQQAMFLSWFVMVIFILLSGLFTPVENMPKLVQYLTYLNPIRYFIEVIRMVMLKGAGLENISFHFKMMGIFAVIFNVSAILRYKKTV